MALSVKTAGDDPDVTNGILVYARVTFAQDDVVKSKVILEAGEGIGRVTQKGLEQSIGDPAINPVPRRMYVRR